MKKIFLKFLIFTLVLSSGVLLFSVNSTYAIDDFTGINNPTNQNGSVPALDFVNNNSTSEVYVDPTKASDLDLDGYYPSESSSPDGTPTSPTTGAGTAPRGATTGSGLTDISCDKSIFKKGLSAIPGYALYEIFSEPQCSILPPIVNLFLKISSWVLWASAGLFNFSMQATLNLVDQTSSFKINEAWGVIRDLINITFIFALLWIAIQTILGLGDSKKFLASIIISALLINFSLFFTKVIIDASNIIALQFYSSITGGKINSSFDAGGGVANNFLDRLKLSGIYNSQGGLAERLNYAHKYIMVGLFGSIFILVTAIVFFFAAILMFIRTVLLMFFMITSPIWFAGAWIPRLNEYRISWTSGFFNQVLVAPVFLILVWIVLKITEPVSTTLTTVAMETLPNTIAAVGASSIPATIAAARETSVTFADFLSNGEMTSIGIVINFIFLTALMVVALNTAKSLSGKMGASGAKMLGTVVGGAGGFLGRQVVGRGASLLAKSETLKDLATRKDASGRPTAMARASMLALKGVEGTAKSSFDVRNTSLPGLGGLTDVIKKNTGGGIDLGRGTGIGGFRTAEKKANDDRVKKQEATAKLLEESKESETKRKEPYEKEMADYEAKKKAHDDAEKAKVEANKKEKEELDGTDPALAKKMYDEKNGDGAYDKKFKATEYSAPKPAPFKNLREVSDERKRAFAEQLRTPTPVSHIINTANLQPFVGPKADKEAARKIEKSIKGDEKLAKFEEQVKESNNDLKKLLEEALKEQIDVEKVTSEQIRKAVAQMNALAEVKKGEVRSKGDSISIEERGKLLASANIYEAKARDISRLREKSDRIQEKIDTINEKRENKPKDDDKKKEKEEESGEKNK